MSPVSYKCGNMHVRMMETLILHLGAGDLVKGCTAGGTQVPPCGYQEYDD